MLRVSLRNLAAHRTRLLLTALSVVLGTAFFTGCNIFVHSLNQAYHNIVSDNLVGVDVRVSGVDDNSAGVPISAKDTIRKIAGVGKVNLDLEQQIVLLAADGKPIQTGMAASYGYGYLPPAQRIGYSERIIDGRPPQRDNEISINQSASQLGRLRVGDHTKLLVPNVATLNVTVVGEYLTPATNAGVGVELHQQQAIRLFTDGKHVPGINVAAEAGVSPASLRNRIAAALPAMKVQTGKQAIAAAGHQVNQALSFLNRFLMIFGITALLVATFIIYNTFSMIVAQRTRELGLLRAIGASRRQLSRSILTEAVMVAFLGTALGILSGLGLAHGLRKLL